MYTHMYMYLSLSLYVYVYIYIYTNIMYISCDSPGWSRAGGRPNIEASAGTAAMQARGYDN